MHSSPSVRVFACFRLFVLKIEFTIFSLAICVTSLAALWWLSKHSIRTTAWIQKYFLFILQIELPASLLLLIVSFIGMELLHGPSSIPVTFSTSSPSRQLCYCVCSFVKESAGSREQEEVAPRNPTPASFLLFSSWFSRHLSEQLRSATLQFQVLRVSRILTGKN